MNIEKLRKIQKQIAKKAILKDKFKKLKYVAGFDVSYKNNRAVAACITMDFNYNIIERCIIKTKSGFPYIPTFFSFKEGPLIIKIYKIIKTKPDILLIHSHGIAHPYFCGCATYVGVKLNKPSIGIASNTLCGKYKKPKKLFGTNPIIYKKRKVGVALLSKKKCKPIFVSQGNKISLKTAVKITKHFITKYKLPLPIQLSHRLSRFQRNPILFE